MRNGASEFVMRARGRESLLAKFPSEGRVEELFIHRVHRPIPSVSHPFLIHLLAPRPSKLEGEIDSERFWGNVIEIWNILFSIESFGSP